MCYNSIIQNTWMYLRRTFWIICIIFTLIFIAKFFTENALVSHSIIEGLCCSSGSIFWDEVWWLNKIRFKIRCDKKILDRSPSLRVRVYLLLSYLRLIPLAIILNPKGHIITVINNMHTHKQQLLRLISLYRSEFYIASAFKPWFWMCTDLVINNNSKYIVPTLVWATVSWLFPSCPIISHLEPLP